MMMADFTETMSVAFNAANDVRKLKAETARNMSRYDNIISDCYHILELMTLNAVQLSKVTKELRNNLRLRREAKEQMILIETVLANKFENIQLTMTNKSEVRAAKYTNEAKQAYARLSNKANQDA